jgi:tripartite-type tricarboxylate transporter receptor subunit TctC
LTGLTLAARIAPEIIHVPNARNREEFIMPTSATLRRCATALLLASAMATPSEAQSPPDLAGKQVTVIIGFGTGSGYDTWGRIVARHIGRYLPGKPTAVPQNMPGAGSFVAINNIYTVAPKDGSVIAIIARDAALGPLSGAPGARFDSTKLTWVGTPTTETNVCLIFHTAKAKTVEDLFKMEVILGDTGPGTGTYVYPKALNGLLGTKFKLITGFPASSDVFLAIDRGEVDGMCESLDSAQSKRPDWIKEKKIKFLFQGGAAPNPEIADVPFINDFAKTDAQRQALAYLYAGQGLGRPFIAPPGMTPDRVKMLRDAFNATMLDTDFKADVVKAKLQLAPVTGEVLTERIAKIYATPREIIDQIAQLIK